MVKKFGEGHNERKFYSRCLNPNSSGMDFFVQNVGNENCLEVTPLTMITKPNHDYDYQSEGLDIIDRLIEVKDGYEFGEGDNERKFFSRFWNPSSSGGGPFCTKELFGCSTCNHDYEGHPLLVCKSGDWDSHCTFLTIGLCLASYHKKISGLRYWL